MGQEVTREREQVRASVAMTVRYSDPSEARPQEGVCQNLSSSGMFLGTPRPASVGVMLRFECESEGGSGLIRGVARVVWLRAEAAGEGRPAGMGLRFLSLESGSEQQIARLLSRGDLGTSGRSARSEPPIPKRSDPPPRPRLVAVTAIREVGAPDASQDRRSSPPAGRKARGAGELRERWKQTRRQIKSDPPTGGDEPAATTSSNPPPPQQRTTQPEAPGLDAPPSSVRAVQQDYQSDVRANHAGSSPLPPPLEEPPAGHDFPDFSETAKSDVGVRARRLADLVEAEAEAQRGRDVHEAYAATPQGRVEEGVLVRNPSGASRGLVRLAIGMLVVGGAVLVVLHRRSGADTQGSPAPHVVDSAAPASPATLAAPAPVPGTVPGTSALVPLPRGLDVPADLADQDRARPQPEGRQVASRASRADRRASTNGDAPSSPAPAAPEESAAASEAEGNPLETAVACLKVGDSACAVKALEGRARTEREWELLIESHRALGNTSAAEGHMRSYLERFPAGSARASYQRLLGYRQAPPAVDAPESAVIGPAPDAP